MRVKEVKVNAARRKQLGERAAEITSSAISCKIGDKMIVEGRQRHRRLESFKISEDSLKIEP